MLKDADRPSDGQTKDHIVRMNAAKSQVGFRAPPIAGGAHPGVATTTALAGTAICPGT